MSDIALIAGLGNPGSSYEATRHNVGCWFVNELCSRYKLKLKLESRFKGEVASTIINGTPVRVFRPSTFMNESGESIGPLMRYFGIAPEELLVVHDDLDLESGIVRLKNGGGHGGHNGLRDVIRHLGSAKFFRLRIGISHPGSPDAVTDYVLHRPSIEERSDILSSIEYSIGLLDQIVKGDHASVMNNLHAPKASSGI